MASPEIQTDVSAKKMLPWLKRLKGALDDDDSSDSTSQQSEATPQKATKDKRPQHGKKRKESPKRQGKGRLVRHSSKSPKHAGKTRHAPSESSSSGDEGEIRRRRVEKAARRKRLKLGSADGSSTAKTASKKAKAPVDAAPANAAASREKRVHKLRALGRDTGEGARLTAFKLKRQQSSEALNERERIRMRGIRARRVSEGAEADVEDEGGTRPRPSPLGKRRKSRELKPVISKDRGKRKPLAATASLGPADHEEEDVAGSAVTTKNVLVDEAKTKSDDGENTMCPTATTEPVNKKAEHVEASNDENVKSAEPLKEEDGEHDKNDKTTKDVTSGNSLTFGNQKPNEGQHATPVTAVNTTVAVVKQEEVSVKPCADANDTNVVVAKQEEVLVKSCADVNDTIVVVVKQEKVSMKSCVIANAATSECVKLKEGQSTSATVTKSTPDPSVTQLGDGEKKVPVKNEQMLLDAMPIPRKTVKSGPDPTTNASSFVIPKRPFAKPVGQMEAPKVQANKDGNKRSLEPRVPVVLKPLPSPEASPQLSKTGLIRPQRKRTKNPVPVKHVAISKQDKAMMRLAKRRNSIFMATAEISVQSPAVNDAATPSTSRMTGYEIFDVHGKTLPDLIPRLSCATKREIASNRESYAASFFGVSLSTPKAKCKASPTPDDCVADEAKTREINCYEKLCFERPKDREFYQQRMYGTTFVPQSLRGWITVIIRDTRFERKSTGIRFNQDRDRDEFAMSLVKRYTINKSIPRCDIPRDNWQRLMRNQPGTVYLHYYNREDAKQASQVFRDDFGNPLELKTEYKAGVVISPSSSPAADLRFQGTPRRSCSSERYAPRPSPFSSQNGSARNTPMRQRDRLQALKGANRFSRYDRGPPPGAVPWPRDVGRYVPSLSGNKRPRRSRSRSRSKFNPPPSERYDPAARNSGASSTSVESSSHLHKVKDEVLPEYEEGIGAGSKSSDGTLAQKRAASRSPLWSRSSCQKRTMSEKETHSDRGVNGERENRAVRAQPGGIDDSGRAHHTRSPRGRWPQQPNRSERHEQRGRSRENVMGYRQGQERVNHPQDIKTRPRSPRRQPSPSFGGRGGHRDAPYTKERRQQSQDFASGDGKTRGERIPNRYDGQDYRNRGPNDRRGGMHSQR